MEMKPPVRLCSTLLLQIVDVALLLGYSEHSAFTRAFRKMNGITPQQMRMQVRDASGSRSAKA
jgi:AraC-like DNA-binding protein